MTLNKFVAMKALAGFVFIFQLGLPALAYTQNLPSTPTKPSSDPIILPAPSNTGSYSYLYQFGLVCGAGASYSSFATKAAGQCGGLIVWPFIEFEIGAMGPQANQNAAFGYFGIDGWVPLGRLESRRGVALVTGGYKRIFGTANALDYGVEYASPVDGSHSVRVEVRDDWTFSNPRQHNVVLRVAWLVGVPD